ncbi:putative ABC transporter permease [Clostridium sp.]|uniref:putative ABC transporter permease n=1 Tax=Clostridium sp. TaxID=1506 RepID=UPI00346414E7
MFNLQVLSYPIYELLFFFIIYSFLGWILEIIYAYYSHGHFVNRGFLNGPFCPIYGFGALSLVLFLDNFKNNIFLLFILGTIFTSLIEYLTAVILEKAFNTTWWDYTENSFNIKGRVCLSFSLIWGGVSVVLVRFIHPYINTLVTNINYPFSKILFYSFFFYFLIDFILTLKSLMDLNHILSELYNLSKDTINHKYFKDLKSKLSKTDIPHLKEAKIKYTSLMKNLTPNHKRILQAFPSMKFMGVANFITDIKDKIFSLIKY